MTKNLRVKSSEYIDETNRISFKFNGKTYHGFKGDTLASALLANNVHLVGRSFKYHRPRGIMTSGSDCLLYTSPSPRDTMSSRMPSSA